MPQARSIRQRTAGLENDENSGSTRLTRAKAASLGVGDDGSDKVAKKPLATKRSAINMNATRTAGSKRAALGDVSNVSKTEAIDAKEIKKPIASKAGLASKAQTNGVQKPARTTTSTRSVLGAKDSNKRTSSSELKRPASGPSGGAVKRRNTGSTGSQQSAREDAQENIENQPPKQNGQSEKKVMERVVERKTTVEVTEKVVAPQVESKAALEPGVPDLDAEDMEDPLMVAEYVVEIFDHLRGIEQTSMPNPDYMEHQTHLDWSLRDILMDWLVEVHTRFHLLPETIFLAVNIIDRFLSARIVQLDKLQLVGITAMFIASKYEEVVSPHVQNFKHVADDGFSEEEILKAERFVLETLNYDLSYPNPLNFLRRISKADNYDIHTRTFGKYLLELSLLDHRFLSFAPSLVAASAMNLARCILERGDWDSTLCHYSGYSDSDIQPVLRLMVDYLRKPVAHEAFFKKYSSKKFMKASIFARGWAKTHWQLYVEDLPAPTRTQGRPSLEDDGYSFR